MSLLCMVVDSIYETGNVTTFVGTDDEAFRWASGRQ